MKAAEQLSAMEMMAVNPMARVIAPRFWGGVISMPLLAAMFSTMGIFLAAIWWGCSCWGWTPAISGHRCRAR